MNAPLFRIARHTNSLGYRVACLASFFAAAASAAGAFYVPDSRVALSILTGLSILVGALALQGLISAWTIEVVLHEDRIEWGVVGRQPRSVVPRRDVQSMLLGTGMDHDISYAFLRNGTKVEIGLFGGSEHIKSLAAALQEHWPETPVTIEHVT